MTDDLFGHADGSTCNRRIWLGRGEDGIATLALMDAEGRRRLLKQVGADGETRFSVLDAEGRVLRELVPFFLETNRGDGSE